MNSVENRIDQEVDALYRRDRAWSWFLLLIPIQALGCLIAFLLHRWDLRVAVLAFSGAWVPTLLVYFLVDRLLWHRFNERCATNPVNLSVNLLRFNRDGKRNDSAQHFADFETLKPAFVAWKDEGMPRISDTAIDLMVMAAEKFPTIWLGVGPQPDLEVYRLMFTALLSSGRDDAACELRRRYEKHFKHSLEPLELG